MLQCASCGSARPSQVLVAMVDSDHALLLRMSEMGIIPHVVQELRRGGLCQPAPRCAALQHWV